MSYYCDYDIDILLKTDLYKGLTETELHSIIDNRYGRFISYDKYERVFNEGDKPVKLYMLIEGCITIARETYTGGRMLVNQIREAGSLFGEIYSYMKQAEYRVFAEVSEDAVVFEIDQDVINKPSVDTRISTVLRDNLLNIFANKAFTMNKRLLVLGSSNLREKIARFILQHQTSEGKLFICMTRDEMADYLNVTRPSLSRELGNMARDGIIALEGRKIIVKAQDKLEELL